MLNYTCKKVGETLTLATKVKTLDRDSNTTDKNLDPRSVKENAQKILTQLRLDIIKVADQYEHLQSSLTANEQLITDLTRLFPVKQAKQVKLPVTAKK